MISISKNETKWLREHGVKMGENGISRTHSHHVNYFLCESERNLELLKQYNDEIRGRM